MKVGKEMTRKEIKRFWGIWDEKERKKLNEHGRKKSRS